MTTIVLTSIGILIAAAAALMVVFYGGDAFNGGSSRAEATTIQNAGANVRSAAQLYQITNRRPATDFGVLVAAGNIDEMPGIPDAQASMQWEDMQVDGRMYKAFVVDGVRDDVCGHINKKIVGDVDAPLETATGLFGCVRGQETDANRYYAIVSQPRPGGNSGPILLPEDGGPILPPDDGDPFPPIEDDGGGIAM